MSRANRAYDRLVAGDELVIKVLGVSEISQIARAETRMREYLLARWQELADEAAKKASGKGTAKQIMAVIDQVMSRWSKEVERRYLEEFTRIYFQARTAGWKKTNGLIRERLTYDIPEGKVEKAAPTGSKLVRVMPFFDVVDDRVVAALREHQKFWIGTHYDERVSDGVARVAQEGVKAGLHPRELQERLRFELGMVTVPSGYRGSDKSYFEGVVANAATVARVQGQMRSFIDYGVTTYEIVNPRDSRTCEECLHMDGKTFAVRQGADVMEDTMAAKTPEQVKEAQPWMKIDAIREISPTAGKAGPEDAAKLAEARFCLPPFHFKCRCTVDISEDIGSWRPAGPGEEPPVPAPPVDFPPPGTPPIKPPGLPPIEPKPVPPAEKRPPPPRPRVRPTAPKQPRAPKQPTPAAGPVRPASFPACRDVPTKPMQPYDEERLCKILRNSPAPMRNGRIKNSESARREFHSLCAEKGMHPRDMNDLPLSFSQKLHYGTQKASGGLHWSLQGEITIQTDSWNRLQQWATNPAPQRHRMMAQPQSRWPFNLVLHETIHGHGPMQPMPWNVPDQFKKLSRLIEEMATEMSTIKISVEKFGGRLQDFMRGAHAISIYSDSIHSYSYQIDHVMQKEVGKVWTDLNAKLCKLEGAKNDWEKVAAQRMFADAAIRFKQLPGGGKDFDDWVNKFIGCFEVPPEAQAGLTKAQAAELTDRVRKGLKNELLDKSMQHHASKAIKD